MTRTILFNFLEKRARLLAFLAVFPFAAFLMIFQPPATWSEIFFLASLKRTPLTIAVPTEGSHWQINDPELLLHKAPFAVPWLISLNTSLAQALAPLELERFWSTPGESLLIAHRLLCGVVALLVFLCLTPLFSHDTHSTQSSRNGQQARYPQLRISASIAALMLMLLVRLGAIEQLFILAGLALLYQLRLLLDSNAANTSKPGILFLTGMAAFALACANSRGWIYSLAASAVGLSLLKANFRSHLLRWVVFSGLTFLLFAGLFLLFSDYESFVSHLTQRWVYLNDPRYLTLQWPGASLIWIIISAWIAMHSLRRMIFWFIHPERSQTPVFLELLGCIAGFTFAWVQKTPNAADALLLLLLFFSIKTQITTPTHATHPKHKNIVRLAALLPRLFNVTLALVVLFSIVLIVWPGTPVVDELRQLARGVFLLVHSNISLSLVCFLLAIWALAEGVRRSKRKDSQEYSQRTYLLVGLALFAFTELRSKYVWNHLERTLAAVPPNTQLLFLPRLEPLVNLYPNSPQIKRMVTIFEGEVLMHNQPRSMLLVSEEASEVCRSAGWQIEASHGTFELCDVGQGSLFHLFPLN